LRCIGSCPDESMVTGDLRIEPVPLVRVVPLRAAVLRDGDMAAAVWALDDHPQAVHLAASVGEDLLGVTSVVPDPLPEGTGAAAWRLRGVAVREDVRGQGIASALVAEVVRRIPPSPDPPQLLWCNARTSALGFWERAGFEIVGKEFVTDTGIPHFRAVRLLRPAA
jgi:GNAT superfamily N-acetyltransferase